MCEFIALPLILCSVSFGLTQGTNSYDQRQTGDFNVQIGLKNIQLIALLKGGKEEYVDYDYAYDYSEMTIKPQNGTTAKPLTGVNLSQNNGTTLAPPPILTDNNTTIDNTQTPLNSSTIKPLSNQLTNSTETYVTNYEVINTTEVTENSSALCNNQTSHTTEISDILQHTNLNDQAVLITTSSTHITETASEPTNTQESSNNVSAPLTSHCRRGFVKNHQGKCEYKGHGTTNALRRIVKLAQKIKIGREYKET